MQHSVNAIVLRTFLEKRAEKGLSKPESQRSFHFLPGRGKRAESKKGHLQILIPDHVGEIASEIAGACDFPFFGERNGNSGETLLRSMREL